MLIKNWHLPEKVLFISLKIRSKVIVVIFGSKMKSWKWSCFSPSPATKPISFVVPSSLSVYCIFYFPAFVQFSNLNVKLKEIFRDLRLKHFFMINLNFAQSRAFPKVIMTCPNLATKINNNLILQLFMSNYCCNFIVLVFLLQTF